MNKTETAVKTEEAAAPATEVVTVVDDKEARIAALEAEKAKLSVERDNYRLGMLKAKGKATEDREEDEDEKIRRIAREEMINSDLARITKEQDALIQAALKENKELKLAHLNKNTTPPAAVGTHSEGIPVRDTLITPEQSAHFKALGKDDKWIEMYKNNLRKKI